MANSRSEHQWLREMVVKFAHILNQDARVLEIGAAIESKSGHVQVKEYVNLDVAEEPDIDVVSIAHKYDAPDNSFDVVWSFSAFEHDMYWKKTLKKMVDLTRPGGLVLFACCLNWEEHGTNRTSPQQSLTTRVNKKWAEYYRNVTPEDVRKVWKLDELFSEYYLGTNPYDDGFTCFWGIKK